MRTFVRVIHDSKLAFECALALLNASDHIDAFRRHALLIRFHTHPELAFDEQVKPEIRVRKRLNAVPSRPEIPLHYFYEFFIVHK